MKISKKEAQAAIRVYYDSDNETAISAMRAALEAAYTVRKARKAAKRAKERPEHPEPDQPELQFKVGDRVTYAKVGGGKVVRVDENDANRTYLVDFDLGYRVWPKNNELSPEPAAPEWSGKFEVGKAYRTRSGQKATIDSRLHQLYTGVYPLVGQYRNEPWSWMECGRADITKETPRDIVGPWED